MRVRAPPGACMLHTGYSDPSTNLLARLDASLSAHGADEALLPVVPFRPAPVDVRLELRDPAWRRSAAGRRALSALAVTDAPVGVRFDHTHLASLGAALERGERDPL